MNIELVTFTGADDSVSPSELLSRAITLAENNATHIELGLLLGREYTGNLRFPSELWLNNLCDAVDSMGYDFDKIDVTFSGHLCGDYVKEFLMGKNYLEEELPRVWNLVSRIQLNTHGISHTFDADKLFTLITNSNNTLNKSFIFQIDQVNDYIFQLMVSKHNYDWTGVVLPLFDLSHGTGKRTYHWPPACYNCNPHGYAGGISPLNLPEVIKEISQVVNEHTSIWLDMETHIRSNSGQLFDLDKVTAVVEQLPKYSSHGVLIEQDMNTY